MDSLNNKEVSDISQNVHKKSIYLDFFKQIFKKIILLSGPRQNSVGISIGHQNVIAVELDTTGDIPRLVRLIVKEIGSTHMPLPEVLRDIVKNEGLSTATVNTSLSGKSVLVRFIKLPHMNQKELRSALEFEAEKYIPFEVSEVFLDYDVMEEDIHKRFTEVALVVAKKEAVHELLVQCKEAGLLLRCIDIDSFACLHTFEASYPEEKDKTVALINIGAKLTNLMIVSQGVPAFSRDIYFGGDDITEGLSKKLNVAPEEAAQLKFNLENAPIDNIKVIVREIFNYLITEVKLSFEYAKNQLNKENVDIIYLVGGSSQLSGLVSLIEETTGITAVTLDPLRSITIDESIDQDLLIKHAASLAVPIGLALRQ